MFRVKLCFYKTCIARDKFTILHNFFQFFGECPQLGIRMLRDFNVLKMLFTKHSVVGIRHF